MSQSSTPHHLGRLTPQGWQALLMLPEVSAGLTWQEIKETYPLSPSPTGWAVLSSKSKQALPVAAVWLVLERPHQWRLIWATQPGESTANEALFAHLTMQAQRQGINHFTCGVHHTNTALAGLLKAHGFRHVATQSRWQTVLEKTAHLAKPASSMPSLRLARYNDAWPVFELAQECCPVHARPYLMPWPPSWKRDSWALCQRFIRGEYQHQWVLERPVPQQSPSTARHSACSAPELIGHVQIRSAQYPIFHVSTRLSNGWEDQTPEMVQFVLAQVQQQALQPTIIWRTDSHQQRLEEELKHRGFEVTSQELLLVRDVWTSLTPNKATGLSELLMPTEPLYGSAHTSSPR